MTTNHREKLDAALLRPGRTDFQVCLNNASHDQMCNLFRRFNDVPLEDTKDNRPEEFARQLPEGKISVAKL